jgi:protein TonB
VSASQHRKPILDERDPLRGSFAGSVVLHVAVFLGLAAFNYLNGSSTNQFGDPAMLSGGTVAITPVNQIPLPQRTTRVNPLANDTQSLVPEAPKPEPRRAPEPEPEAVAIPSRTKQEPAKKRTTPSRKKQAEPQPQNQVNSSSGAQISTPLFGVQGAGGVGIGNSNPFGNRFGYYASLVRQRVGQQWKTSEIDARLRTAPPVIVTFDVGRDGRVGNVRLLQSSGNPQLDRSCQRAVLEASPLPPLPPGFERNSANIEFWFQLER